MLSEAEELELLELEEAEYQASKASAFMEESPQNEIPTDTMDLNTTPITGNYVLQRGVVPAGGKILQSIAGKDAVDTYNYAKDNKSIYDKDLYQNFLKKSMSASDEVTGNIAKQINDYGSEIQGLREAAEAKGIRIPTGDLLDVLKTDLSQAISKKTISDPNSLKQAENILESTLGDYSTPTKIGENISVVKPKNVIETDVIADAKNALQSKMDDYNFLKTKEGIKTFSAPIQEESGRFFSTINDAPIETNVPSAKSGSIKISADSDLDNISGKLQEYKALSLNKGKSLNIGAPNVVNGNLIFPTTEISSNLPATSGSSKTFVEKIPYGANNPITYEIKPILETAMKGDLSPLETKNLIDTLHNFAKNSKDDSLKSLINKATAALRNRENSIDASMKPLKQIYGKIKDTALTIPGMGDSLGGEDLLNENPLSDAPLKKSTIQTKKYLENLAVNRAFDDKTPTSIDNKVLTKDFGDTEEMIRATMKEGDAPIPKFLEPIDSLKEDSDRLALLKRVGGNAVGDAEAAADILTKSRPVSMLQQYSAKAGDVVGKFIKNNPKVVSGVKGLGKGLGIAAPAASIYLLREEALQAGLTEEEAGAYAAALTGVDTAATGAGMLTTATGVGAIPGIAASLSPLVREARKMWNPESAKDKLELFKQYKAKGDSTTVAMAKLAADQAGETAMAIPGTISDIGSALVPSQEQADKYIESKSAFAGWGNKPKVNPNDSFLQRMEKTQLTLPGMSPNKNYSNDKLSQALQTIESDPKPWMNTFKESLQRALNAENKQERGRELFNLQQQPAFGAMMKKFNIEADE